MKYDETILKLMKIRENNIIPKIINSVVFKFLKCGFLIFSFNAIENAIVKTIVQKIKEIFPISFKNFILLDFLCTL
ncbi:hypothetical protein GCM10022250_06780 [Flavobacterium chungbukense]|uniref:Uncharacterized protein n=1 Tax=Flavobacterium chungbukense TaxID=877464 RepID=A0ABP7XPW9_9FLAO